MTDASVLVASLTAGGDLGAVARNRLATAADLHAPHVVDAEVLSALRGLVRRGRLPLRVAQEAIGDLMAMHLTRHDHVGLVSRAWQLRDRLPAYDALYIALAEALGATLVTADARLGRAGAGTCLVDVVHA